MLKTSSKWINPRQQLHQLLEDMYDNTLIIFTSDNGGPIYEPGAASNHPLRGSKYNDWEGGVRTNAFVSGESLNILAHQWSDWGCCQIWMPARLSSSQCVWVNIGLYLDP